MRIPREARKLAREMFRGALVGGRLDEARLRAAVARAEGAKPRRLREALVCLKRFVRLELEKSRAVIESAVPLDPAARASVEAGLRARYGAAVAAEHRVDPSLIGGLRIRVGSDVWDGSVRGRLERLGRAFEGT